MKGSEILSLGFIFIVIGVVLIFVGTLTSSLKAKDTEIRGGGVILIGPFPIIFGSDPQAAKGVIILAILLIFVAFLFFTQLGK
jgi:uncharacterized protein (TIGR00304 family)